MVSRCITAARSSNVTLRRALPSACSADSEPAQLIRSFLVFRNRMPSQSKSSTPEVAASSRRVAALLFQSCQLSISRPKRWLRSGFCRAYLQRRPLASSACGKSHVPANGTHLSSTGHTLRCFGPRAAACPRRLPWWPTPHRDSFCPR